YWSRQDRNIKPHFRRNNVEKQNLRARRHPSEPAIKDRRSSSTSSPTYPSRGYNGTQAQQNQQLVRQEVSPLTVNQGLSEYSQVDTRTNRQRPARDPPDFRQAGRLQRVRDRAPLRLRKLAHPLTDRIHLY